MTPIQSSRLSQAEFKRITMFASPEAGTQPEDLLDEDYWKHVRRAVAPGTKIEVFAEDGSFYAELLVLGVTDAGLQVAYLFEPRTFAQSAVADIDFQGHTLRYAGTHRKWVVIRKERKNKAAVLLRDGFANAEDARSYVKEQAKAQAA